MRKSMLFILLITGRLLIIDAREKVLGAERARVTRESEQIISKDTNEWVSSVNK